jgi:ABC-type sugar transport system permease subunit
MGRTGGSRFWHVTFPITLPVSVTVLIIRIIFKLKLADIVINVTAGGPGGATDTVSSFIYRVYRDRSNGRIRHRARDLLSAFDHCLPDPAAAPCPIAGRRKLREPAGGRFLKGVARLPTIALASKPVRQHHAASRVKRIVSRALIYGALLFWAFVCLFPIYWTVTTSFKSAVDAISTGVDERKSFLARLGDRLPAHPSGEPARMLEWTGASLL